LKLVPVTLTLPGIGGFILSLGMAVDANVLIGERTKEELNSGRTLGSSIEAGFSRAWPAIRDSNITTFIVCAVLYWAGGSIAGGATIKGFAMTLFIGVAVSMFTAMLVSRSIFRLFELSPLSKSQAFLPLTLRRKMTDLFSKRRWFFIAGLVAIIISLVALGIFGLKPGIEFSSGSLSDPRL